MSPKSDIENTDGPASNRALLVAVWLTMAGGVVGVVAEFANLPVWLLLAGVMVFMVGTVTAVGFAFRSSRRDGASVVRSLARAVKRGFRWLWEFMP